MLNGVISMGSDSPGIKSGRCAIATTDIKSMEKFKIVFFIMLLFFRFTCLHKAIKGHGLFKNSDSLTSMQMFWPFILCLSANQNHLKY